MPEGKQGRAVERMRRRVVAGVVGGILFTAGVAIVILAGRTASLLESEFAHRASADTRALAVALAGPLERGHESTARSLLAQAAENPDALEASLAGPDGRILASTLSDTLGAPAPAYHERVFRSREPLVFDGGEEAGADALLLVQPVLGAPDSETGERPVLGSVALRLSTARMKAALREGVLMSAASVLLVAAGIGFLVFVALVRAGLRPIETLIQGVERMADGDLGARVRTGRLGAFREVGETLNEMWDGFGSLAARVVGITNRLRSVAERLGGAMEEIDSGSQSQAVAIEETAAMLAEVNESIRRVNGELDNLSRSTEEASSSILEMGSSVDEVARSVTSLNEAVESASSSSQEMGASIRQVAESADEVQRMAEETAASMTEMDRAIQEVGEHVRQASTLTQKVSSGAEDGQEAVNATIEGIEEISTLTGDAKDVLERLNTRIGEIGEIVNVIGGINDETNLLSLNAAIIAAQAGEQGKAFAVVANHVKTLAQRTAMSTGEIERLIQATQDESANAVKAMQAGMSAVKTGVDRSRRAGEALAAIRAQAADANARVTEITRAAEEQARNSVHVAEAANRTSAMVQKISTAMAEQSRASEQMLQTSESALAVCRQVGRSTEEQRQSGAFITQSISQIGEMMRSIQQSMTTHARASQAVSEAVEGVLDVARKTGDRVTEMVSAVEELRSDAEALEAEIGRFQGAGAAPAQAAPESASSAAQSPA